MNEFNKYLAKILYVTILLYSLNAIAADDYMMMLEAEASELGQGGKNNAAGKQPKQASNVVNKKWQGECDFADDTLPSGLADNEFSSYLQQCALGLYVFYNRLDADLQASVYAKYKKSTSMKLSLLRKTILIYF